MRFVDIIRQAIKNSFRSKTRTILTMIAISIGAFTLTLTSAVGAGVNDYISKQVNGLGAQDLMSVSKKSPSAGDPNAGPQKYDPDEQTTSQYGQEQAALTQKDIDRIRGMKHVKKVEPYLSVSPNYIETHGDKYILSSSSASVGKADLAAGKQLDDSRGESEILLPTSYLKPLGFANAKAALEQKVTIGIKDAAGEQQTVEATIVGVPNKSLAGSAAQMNRTLTEHLYEKQKISAPGNQPDVYSRATVTFDTAKTAYATDLKSDLSDAGYQGQTLEDSLGAFRAVINAIVGILNGFAVIALIAAGFGIVNTLFMSVQERTREIGLMKAMGMPSGRIFMLFSTEAVFIGLLGSALGVVVAIGAGLAIGAIVSGLVATTLPGLQIILFEPVSIIVIMLVVMLIAFLAGTLPAARASRQNPIDALRYE